MKEDKMLFASIFFSACLGTFADYDGSEHFAERNKRQLDSDEYNYSDYYEDKVTGSKPDDDWNDKSTTPPPLYKKGGPNDIKIEQIPICWDDPDNIDCGNVYINVKDLENREKIYLTEVGFLYLDYASEENGIHSLVYSGEGDVTAYFTYFGSSLMGTINRQDGKIAKIMSTAEHKQVMSLIDVPHSLKTEDDEDEYSTDPAGDKKTDFLGPEEKQLLLNGEADSNSIVQVSVTVYYNQNAGKQMMAVIPEVYIRGLINEVNDGYRKSQVPIKIVLHEFAKAESESVTDQGLGQACNKALEELKLNKYGYEIMDDVQKDKKCQKSMLGQFRTMKGEEGDSSAQSKRVRNGANIAVLLVNEIPERSNFCGRASRVYDIVKSKINLSVVSIAGACEYTFGHEIGHLLGLSHQKQGKDQNRYFSYGHGYGIKPKQNGKHGTRSVMATSSTDFKQRLNVYSNPRIGTGTVDTEDNARVLRETRYLAAYVGNKNKEDLKYSVVFECQTCQKSSICLPLASCSDVMRPQTYLKKLCGYEKVCCEKSPGCVNKFPEIENKEDGWFMFGNRQNSLTLTVGDSRADGTYFATVFELEKGNTKQMWKWEGDLLVSRWNTEYVFDGSVNYYIVSRRAGSKYQKWRFSDGFLVNLGVCKETTIAGDMTIARKWYRIEADEKVKQKNTKPLPSLTYNTYLCLDDEICTDIDHCFEAVTPATLPTKFCDKDKVCCKNKVCHDVKEFEDTETPVTGWFVIENEMNQKFLTVKDGTGVHGQQVVNSSPKTGKEGQLWMWKEGYIVSKLDNSLVLDGSFGKVSIKNKKHGHIYQKWRKSGGFLVNAGHCEVLDVAYGKTDNDALVTIWSVHGKSHQKWTTKPV